MEPSEELQTKWVVFTGPPCSGKTTCLKRLERDYGYEWIPEQARCLVEQRLTAGESLDSIRRGDAEKKFQNDVWKLKVEVESHLEKDQVYLLDRALPDSLAYARVLGMTGNDSQSFAAGCKRRRYASPVFFFEEIPSDALPQNAFRDGVRIEQRTEVQCLSQALLDVYGDLGYTIFHVPFASVDDRVALILQELKRQDLFPSASTETH